ncbi:MAG TPA: PQQ-binding-like beta-propeller repeat protein, partial [Pirellulales bacterium]
MLLAAFQAPLAARAADWAQFRGPASNSVVAASEGPADWDLDKMIAWKVELPGRGPSSPIVVGDRIFVTASSGTAQDRLHVLCFDAADGKRRWERQFWATGRTITHPQSANAAPTPASDGRSVFAFFSSNDLAALDLEGNLLWYRGLALDYPRIGNDAGMSSSPLVIDDVVIVQTESLGGALVVGIDARDGSTRWRDDREKNSSWTSPIRSQYAPTGAPAALVQSVNRLDCLDPTSGKQLWSYSAACDGISSACTAGGLIFLPSQGITALRSTAGKPEPEIVWKSNQLQPGAASPVVAEG